jgi:transcriptional regulator with XRE-family HTH domain
MPRAAHLKRAPPGPDLLKAFIEARNVSYKDAGKAVGVSGTSVWQWVHRQKVPTIQRCEDIATWTANEVPFESWGVERPLVQPFASPKPTGTGER